MNIFEVLLLQPLANGLVLSYRLLGGNMGLAIIAFSLFLRFALNPLTKPYMESMKKMKDYQKELNKLKQKHKGDRQKFMQAQKDFYKDKGINPSAGCLPYLLQIVVLIAFFNVFSRVLKSDANIINNFNQLLYPPLQFAADAIVNTKFLIWDITKPDTITGILPIAIPGPLLILAAITQFVSAKITQPYLEAEEAIAKNPNAVADYKKGKEASIKFLIGKVMAKTKGKANPKLLNELLRKKLRG